MRSIKCLTLEGVLDFAFFPNKTNGFLLFRINSFSKQLPQRAFILKILFRMCNRFVISSLRFVVLLLLYQLSHGLTGNERQIFLGEHNKYRKMLMQGLVPGQPRAAPMQMLVSKPHFGCIYLKSFWPTYGMLKGIHLAKCCTCRMEK